MRIIVAQIRELSWWQIGIRATYVPFLLLRMVLILGIAWTCHWVGNLYEAANARYRAGVEELPLNYPKIYAWWLANWSLCYTTQMLIPVYRVVSDFYIARGWMREKSA